MKQKLIKSIFAIGIFAGGVFFGKQIQKKSQTNKRVYSGVLQITKENDETNLYLVLDVTPETLAKSADVIFKVQKI